eukprot:Amastigsp_a1258_11.p7 type:complete len:104 gc:universal Amastigsp_a1258_11:2235-2546(+)
MAHTTMCALPETTKALLSRNGAASDLGTSAESPVTLSSLTMRRSASTRTPSAGMMSPASSTTMSPTTSSVTRMFRGAGSSSRLIMHSWPACIFCMRLNVCSLR